MLIALDVVCSCGARQNPRSVYVWSEEWGEELLILDSEVNGEIPVIASVTCGVPEVIRSSCIRFLALTLEDSFVEFLILLGDILSVVSVSYPSSCPLNRSSSKPSISELDTITQSSQAVTWLLIKTV